MDDKYFYVARDINGDLFLYKGKPFKNTDYNIWSSVGENFEINQKLFPNVKWEDEEPLAVILQQAVFKSK